MMIGEIMLIMGVPTAVMGFSVWWLQHIIVKFEKKREAKEEIMGEYQLLMLKSNSASLELGDVMACAIRDGHTNGEVSNALIYAREIKKEQRKFLEKQSVNNLF